MLEDTLSRRTHEALEKRVFPGCVIGVHRKGTTHILPFGHFRYDETSPQVTEHTLYDCASLTKSLPTAVLTLQLIENGRITLEDKVVDFLPAFRNSNSNDVTVWHLLTYTLGSAQKLYSDFKEHSAEEITSFVLMHDLRERPGESFRYSNGPALLLGFVLEKIVGPLDRSAQDKIFTPLQMNATTFNPLGAAPTEIDEKGIEIVDIVHDESARVFTREGHVVGHAGLFSTAPDLMRFCEALLYPGELLTQETIQRMTTNQIVHLNASTGLGFELNQPFMGVHREARTFGKTGFTGTSFVCDREREKAVVILSNRTFPQRGTDAHALNLFRSDVCDILFSHE